MSLLTNIVNPVLQRVTDTFFPTCCASCGDSVASSHALCAACWAKMEFITAPMCHRCGLPFAYEIGEHGLCGNCIASAPAYTQARAVFRYSDQSREQLLAFKFHDRTQLAPLFGKWLTLAASQQFLGKCDVIIPVPLHYRRLVARRYNQAGLLAQALSTQIHLPVLPDTLRRKRATSTQTGLQRKQREDNVRGAFIVPKKLRPHVKGKRVLLVDDVMTTGATLSACARALRDAGAVDIYVLTLARTVLE